MSEQSASVVKQHWVRLAPPVLFAFIITWHQPGPQWFWICQNRPCGAMTLIGPLLATILSAVVFGVVYSHV